MKHKKKQEGFTLMEMMVATTIFLIIITLGLMGLLSMSRAQKVTQYKKQQFDILNAVMEDMVRQIRTGSNIRCDVSAGTADGQIEVPLDCPPVDGADYQPSLSIAFENAQGISGNEFDQYIYSIEQTNQGEYALYKAVDGLTGNFTRLTPYPISIDPTKSGFSVLYASDPSDSQQPVITIRLSGTITYQGDTVAFTLQTTVTPRALEFI